MSHVFSTPPGEQGSQRISADEAKQLIRGHQNREAALEGSVTVKDMAETLGLPEWQVEQMVRELRSRPPVTDAPMSSSAWLKTQLWKWVLAAVAASALLPGISALSNIIDKDPFHLSGPPRNRATNTDGIYRHSVVELGRKLGMTATPGFSYRIEYGTMDAAANGDSRHYVDSEELSPENKLIIQKQYANSILQGFDKAIGNTAPDWINGEAVGIVHPNYYDAGTADSFDFTLKKDAFPFDPDKNPESKKLQDEMLQHIQAHWDDIMSD